MHKELTRITNYQKALAEEFIKRNLNLNNKNVLQFILWIAANL